MVERSLFAFGGRTLTVFAIGLALAACQRTVPLAPVVLHTPGASQSRLFSGEPTTIVVHKGDTLYTVTRRYKVPMKTMIITNQLQPPFMLRTGQLLTLPQQKIHVVEKGDTLYSIARRYEVEMSALVHVNRLQSPHGVLVGQVLSIPFPLGRRARTPLRASTPADDGRKVTLADGSPSHGHSDTSPPVTSSTTRSGNAVMVESSPLFPKGESPSQGNVALSMVPTVESTPVHSVTINTHIPLPQLPKQSGQLLLWPVGGKVLNRYGSLGDGTHHDGINIAAPQGMPVRAADNGIVVYVGNELKNFGNLLLIRHASNLLTAYAHHETILVRRGDPVKRGQIIGTVGTSGSVNIPQLYFEVREGVKAVDPIPYLEPNKVPNA